MANEVIRHSPTDDASAGDSSAARAPFSNGQQVPQQIAANARPEPHESLVDILERVLDKGVVIAGDISINLLDIELLTIKVRLLIASVDKAKEMGIDWWTRDSQLSGNAQGAERDGAKQRGERSNRNIAEQVDSNKGSLKQENHDLRNRMGELEARVQALLDGGQPKPRRQSTSAARRRPGRGRK